MWRCFTNLRAPRVKTFPRHHAFKFHSFPGSPRDTFLISLTLAVGTFGALYSLSDEHVPLLEELGSFELAKKYLKKRSSKILASFYEKNSDNKESTTTPIHVQPNSTYDIEEAILDSLVALEDLLPTLLESQDPTESKKIEQPKEAKEIIDGASKSQSDQIPTSSSHTPAQETHHSFHHSIPALETEKSTTTPIHVQLNSTYDIEEAILDSLVALEDLLPTLLESQDPTESTKIASKSQSDQIPTSSSHTPAQETHHSFHHSIPALEPENEIHDTSPVNENHDTIDRSTTIHEILQTPDQASAVILESPHTVDLEPTPEIPVETLPGSETPVSVNLSEVTSAAPVDNTSPSITEQSSSSVASSQADAELYLLLTTLQQKLFEMNQRIHFFDTEFSKALLEQQVLTRDANAFHEYMKIKERESEIEFETNAKNELIAFETKLRRKYKDEERTLDQERVQLNNVYRQSADLERFTHQFYATEMNIQDIRTSFQDVLSEFKSKLEQQSESQNYVTQAEELLSLHWSYAQRSLLLHNLSYVVINILPVLNSMLPFTEQYDNLLKFTKGIELPVISDLTSQIPSDIATKGVPTLSQLKSSFVPCFKKGRIASILPSHPSPLDVLFATTLALFNQMPKGLVDGHDAQSVLARAEYFLERNSLLDSVKEIETLDEVVKKEFAAWLSDAKNRLLMEQVVEKLRTETLALLNQALEDFDK